jgi:hypothetical protein
MLASAVLALISFCILLCSGGAAAMAGAGEGHGHVHGGMGTVPTSSACRLAASKDVHAP